jgi:hypothetical protein
MLQAKHGEKVAQMNLRVPETLRKKIEVEATKSGHSLNWEMVRRLEQSFILKDFENMIESTAQKVAMEVERRLNENSKDQA